MGRRHRASAARAARCAARREAKHALEFAMRSRNDSMLNVALEKAKQTG